MAVKYPGRQGAKFRAARELVLGGATMCQMPGCIRPDRPLLKKGDPGYHRNHRLGATVHHVRTVSSTVGMDPRERENLLADTRHMIPVHRCCNSALRDRELPAPRTVPASRDWGL